MVHLIPHVRDYPNQEYQAELCNKAPLGTPEALLPTWTIYLLVVPKITRLLASSAQTLYNLLLLVKPLVRQVESEDGVLIIDDST